MPQQKGALLPLFYIGVQTQATPQLSGPPPFPGEAHLTLTMQGPGLGRQEAEQSGRGLWRVTRDSPGHLLCP